MITTVQILDQAMSMVTDNSAAARAKMLVWVNAGMQEIAKLRPWRFLCKSATLPLVDGYSVWPADFGEALSWTVGTACILPNDRLSDSDAAASLYGGEYGYRVDDNNTGFTIYPSADSCVLSYRVAVPTYADDSTATVFPTAMLNVLSRFAVTRFYEYDYDERYAGSMQLQMMCLKEAKKWDNRQQPRPRADRRSISWRNT